MTLDYFFEIANIFEKNGFSLFLTGGSVRDFLLYGKFDDMDLVTNANLKEMQVFLNFKSEYEKFQSGKFIYKNKEIDITTLRKEEEYNDFRHPKNIIFVNSPKEEYLRRDFTINALYMNKDGKILDYCHGQKDLNIGLIKMIGNPIKRFKEDPLRILRALRFAYILKFKIDPLIVEAIKKNKHLIKHLNYQKVIEELNKFKAKPNDVRKYLIKHEIEKEIPLFYEKNKKEYLNLWNEKILSQVKTDFELVKEFEKMQKRSLMGQVLIVKENNNFQKSELTIKNFINLVRNNYNFIDVVNNYMQVSGALNKGKMFALIALKDNGLVNYEKLVSLGVSIVILKDEIFKYKDLKDRLMTIKRLNLIIDISLLSLKNALEVIHNFPKRVTILKYSYFINKNKFDKIIFSILVINKVLIGHSDLNTDYPNYLLAYSVNKVEKNNIPRKIAHLNFFDFIKNST